jgi:hypothetical protein
MNFFAILSLAMIFAAFVCFLISFFTRMKPYAKRIRLLFFITAGVALFLFIFWGISRNF